MRIKLLKDPFRCQALLTLADAWRESQQMYIIFGQLEQTWYVGPGLAKFAAQNGTLWDEVYSEGATKIYKVRGLGD